MLRVVMSGQWLIKVSVAGVITFGRDAGTWVVCGFDTAGDHGCGVSKRKRK